MSTSKEKVFPDVAGMSDEEIRDTIIQVQKSVTIPAQRVEMSKEAIDSIQASSMAFANRSSSPVSTGKTA
jgi:hypothetical protein